MIKKIIAVILLSFLFLALLTPLAVSGQGPTPTPGVDNSFGQLRETDAITVPAGFDFTPVTLTPPTQTLVVMTIGITEINTIGQMVTSTFSLIDTTDILPITVVILLAFMALRWLYAFVTNRPGRGNEIDMSGAIDDYYDLQADLQAADDELIDQRRRRAKSAADFFKR